MVRAIRPQIWILPLLLALLVAALGWWGNGRLQSTIEESLRTDLQATLDANVTALEVWITNQTRIALLLAEEPEVRDAAVRVLALQPADPAESPAGPPAGLEELDQYLRQRLRAVGYGLAHLVGTNFAVIAGPMRGRMRPATTVFEEHISQFTELFTTGQPVIITPFKPRMPSRGFPRFERMRGSGAEPGPPPGAAPPPRWGTNEPGGRGGPSQGPGGRFRRGDLTLMQVAAPIRDTNGVVRGALALILNPEMEFTRMLSVARRGDSGETYAFDQNGLMISRSRFDEELRRLGLIEDRDGSTSALNLRLADPGGDLLAGFRPTAPAADQPLTRPVAAAVADGAGLSVEPGRDYRGVPVVSAWRWLPDQHFGVVTQIDAAEAFKPLRLIRMLFLMLFLLLILCANGLLLFSYLGGIWRRRMSEAELKAQQLGQYQLEEKIGEGGMGVVYRANHALLRRETALKLLLPERADARSIRRFEQEVRLTSRLAHPNTIQIYDYGYTPEGVFYYAMEFLRGLNLDELVKRFGPQPEARVAYLLTQICESLAEAHALGLIHRDIKPANVFVAHRGGVPDAVKVLDFGLARDLRQPELDAARKTGVTAIVGTPLYMPPEAIRGNGAVDARSDIYSLGALGYFLVTGVHVFEGPTIMDICARHLGEKPVPPSGRTPNPVSPEFELILLQCLEKDPDRRPQTADALRSLLLATPFPGRWGAAARTGWWDEHRGELATPSGGTRTGGSTPAEATLKIDLEIRETHHL